MPSQGKYSGVPATEHAPTSASAGGAIPVAMPVAGDDDGGGPAAAPHATKVSTFEVAAAGSGTKQEGGSEDDDGGVQVEWTKGEPQPPGYRDKWFAVAFVAHVVAVLATSVALGPGAFAKAMADAEDGTRRMLGSGSSGNNYADLYDDDNASKSNAFDYSDSSSSSSNSGDMAPPPEGFWVAIAAISLLASPILSILSLGLMSKNAVLLIQISLYVGIAICAIAAVVHLIFAPPIGILYGIFTALLIWYAKKVWVRIPYAASNLRAGIEAVRSNLGISLVAIGAVPVLILWTAAWSFALFGTLETDWMKNQIMEEEDTGMGGNGEPQEEMSGLGIFVVMLFTLSFYWSHQVIQNVVRTSVAGVVGTWWFTPLEASSFCSMAVRDSFGRATTYSLGSICFGSLIVAILHIIRNSLRSASNNRRAGILRCVAACLLLYLERLVEYFNKWAFIYVGLYGYGYIEAGKNVMTLFKARGWTTVISDNLVNRLLSIVSLTIGLMVGVATLLVALMFEEFESKGGWLGIGFFIGFLVGIVLSSIMMGVVSSAVDAIIVCYAEAPAEFKESHPDLSAEMESTWEAAWPDLNFGGPVIVSLGGGLGIV